MYVCIYTYIYTYVYTLFKVYVYMYGTPCFGGRANITYSTNANKQTNKHLLLNKYFSKTHICAYVCVCMHIYIYIYIYTYSCVSYRTYILQNDL